MGVPMPKEINCLNFVGLFSFLEKYYGSWGIDEVIGDLIENPNYLIHDLNNPARVTPVSKTHILNPNCWVSNEFSLKLLNNVKKVIKVPHPLFEAGRGAVKENLSKSALFAGKLFGPAFLAKQAARINARFNRTKQVVSRKINRKELAFEFRYFPDVEVTKDVCNWNLGIYTELMHASGVRGIHADEVRCVSNGDECCEFRLRWEKSGIFTRVIKGASIWTVQDEVFGVIKEYEGSLNERDRLIDELVKSENKYRSLFESTATANAMIESDLSISLVNSEFVQLTGNSNRHDDKPIALNSIVHPSDFCMVQEHLLANMKTEDHPSENLEFRIIDKDGGEKNVLCKLGRIPNSMRVIASMMDVTDMRRSEKEKEKLKSKLIRAEKMESLGVMAGGIAHDLNNVLSGIVSYPELLLMDLPESSPIRDPLLTIKESGIKAAAIVQDLLTLARRDVANKEVVNLNDVINAYLQSPEYAKMISYHPKVSLAFEHGHNLLNILGSPVNLSKTIMNLVTNAAEATKGGGEITITTQNCYLEHPIRGYEAFREGEYVQVTVSDTGVGIPRKYLDRIFEPFYSKKVMGRSGTGLGMTVVWGTVNDHNGFIEVESAEGKGTRFRIFFPATRKASKQKTDSRSLKDLMGNGESILVVDDVKEQRNLASGILKRLGYHVQVAENGEEAVEFVKENPLIDLVLLDMIMYPGIDGFETFRRIRVLKPDQKGIIVSGYSETHRVKKAQSIGTGGYVQKPYLLEHLGSAVKKELQR